MNEWQVLKLILIGHISGMQWIDVAYCHKCRT